MLQIQQNNFRNTHYFILFIEMMLYLVCVFECFKGFTEECEGLGNDASSEKLSTAKNLEMKIELIEN